MRSGHDSTIPVGMHYTPGIRRQEINYSALTFYFAVDGGAVNAYKKTDLHPFLLPSTIVQSVHKITYPVCIREPLLVFTFFFFVRFSFRGKIETNKINYSVSTQ